MVDFLRGREKARIELEQIGFDNVLLSAATLIELYVGCRDKRELARFDKGLRAFDTVAITEPVSDLAVEWVKEFCLSHQPLDFADLLNGAIAHLGDYPLHTYNVKDYRYLPGVRLHVF